MCALDARRRTPDPARRFEDLAGSIPVRLRADIRTQVFLMLKAELEKRLGML
jgi:hypothetical protein